MSDPRAEDIGLLLGLLIAIVATPVMLVWGATVTDWWVPLAVVAATPFGWLVIFLALRAIVRGPRSIRRWRENRRLWRETVETYGHYWK